MNLNEKRGGDRRGLGKPVGPKPSGVKTKQIGIRVPVQYFDEICKLIRERVIELDVKNKTL